MEQFRLWAPIVMSILAVILIPWLKWSFNTSLKLSQVTMETSFKGWMDTLETNIKKNMKELYSDKVNQAETEKDIERLQGDVIEMKKEIKELRPQAPQPSGP